MSEEIVTENEVPVETPKSIKFGEFTEGLYKGFKFVYPEFVSVEAAVEKYGEDVILRLVNTAVGNAVRTKVKNGLTKFSNEASADAIEYIAKLKEKNPQGIIFGEDELANWKPFDRELSDARLTKDLQKAVASGDKKEAKRLRAILLQRLSAMDVDDE